MNTFWRDDPAIQEAKQTMIAAIQKKQSSINQIKPPQATYLKAFNATLQQLGEQRGSTPWYPYLGTGIGNGPFVELEDGSVKLDMISGIGVYQFGHSHGELMKAALDGAISNTTMQGNLQQNRESAELIDLLVKTSGLDHCFLSSSGSMANDNALKIAFQKRFPASRVLAFEGAFAGRTLGMCHVTDKPQIRQGVPSTLQVDYLPFYDPIRPRQSVENTMNALEKLLQRYPGEYAVMVMELIQGEGGFYPGSHRFFQTLCDRLKKEQIAIFADEVQTFGRTHSLFAFQHFQLEKFVDIATIGKLSQISATLFTKEYRPNPGLLSQTFTGASSSIFVAKRLIKLMHEEGFFGNSGKNQWVQTQFEQGFETIRKKHPDWISGPYGLGAMVAFTPFDGDPKRSLALTHKLYELGVISFICGKNPTRIRFLPPVGVIEHKHIELVCALLEEALSCI